jgi:uncharacterized protein (DUF2384 family)
MVPTTAERKMRCMPYVTWRRFRTRYRPASVEDNRREPFASVAGASVTVEFDSTASKESVVFLFGGDFSGSDHPEVALTVASGVV